MLNSTDPSVKQIAMNWVLREVQCKELEPCKSKESGKKDQKAKEAEQAKDIQFHYRTDKEEKLLVDTRLSMEEEFCSSKSHTTLWQKVKNSLSENNVHVTSKQAQDKWKNLKKKYKEVEDNNNR
ncbi:uncharacterized protein LOC125649244 [Ostrea edulis]|uniref:uncharacterized protein LOC125649244 n=1 Tax=Ostrea edulis TaxID=37623 RepID=UPI0024AF59BE|nr:uncharacterized protein LOC125649244 [Ostrea edulis]